jgi:hypothetical protein
MRPRGQAQRAAAGAIVHPLGVLTSPQRHPRLDRGSRRRQPHARHHRRSTMHRLRSSRRTTGGRAAADGPAHLGCAALTSPQRHPRLDRGSRRRPQRSTTPAAGAPRACRMGPPVKPGDVKWRGRGPTGAPGAARPSPSRRHPRAWPEDPSSLTARRDASCGAAAPLPSPPPQGGREREAVPDRLMLGRPPLRRPRLPSASSPARPGIQAASRPGTTPAAAAPAAAWVPRSSRRTTGGGAGDRLTSATARRAAPLLPRRHPRLDRGSRRPHGRARRPQPQHPPPHGSPGQAGGRQVEGPREIPDTQSRRRPRHPAGMPKPRHGRKAARMRGCAERRGTGSGEAEPLPPPNPHRTPDCLPGLADPFAAGPGKEGRENSPTSSRSPGAPHAEDFGLIPSRITQVGPARLGHPSCRSEASLGSVGFRCCPPLVTGCRSDPVQRARFEVHSGRATLG